MKYIYAVCFLLLVCGCHKENDTPVVLPARTLLVYLGGDNNLDAETYDKLVQIKNGWEDGTDGNIIVYQDTPFKDSPRLMEIDGGHDHQCKIPYYLIIFHISIFLHLSETNISTK